MFDITHNMSVKIDEFKDHDCNLEKDEFGLPKTGAIGGRFTFCFTQTGLGEICVVKCMCGEEVNVTEFEDW